MHEARGQLVVVVEGAPLVHPSLEDAFVDAQALTPSIDEGVEPKIKTVLEGTAPPASSSTAASPRCTGSRSSRARWKTSSSSSSWSNRASISRQKRSSLMVSSCYSCILVSTIEPGAGVPTFITPKRKNRTSWGTYSNTNRWGVQVT